MGSRFQVFTARQLSKLDAMTYLFADGGTAPRDPAAAGGLQRHRPERAGDRLGAVPAVDKPTILNLTSHAFFNLNGRLGEPVLDHVVTIHADRVLEVDDGLIPTGTLRDVAGMPMDYLRGRLTWIRFLGLGLGDLVPDPNTIWTFHEALTKAGAVERLFELFDGSFAPRLSRHSGSLAPQSTRVDEVRLERSSGPRKLSLLPVQDDEKGARGHAIIGRPRPGWQRRRQGPE